MSLLGGILGVDCLQSIFWDRFKAETQNQLTFYRKILLRQQNHFCHMMHATALWKTLHDLCLSLNKTDAHVLRNSSVAEILSYKGIQIEAKYFPGFIP